MHDVHSLYTIRYGYVSGDTLAMCACTGSGLDDLTGMASVSVTGRNAERELTYPPERIQLFQKFTIHGTFIRVRTVEFF